MTATTTKHTSKIQRIYLTVSTIMYALTILITSGVLIFPPNDFNARAIIVPLIVLLFISAIGIGYELARNTPHRMLSVLGTICIASMLTFIGFFLIAGVGWFVGVYQAL